MFYLLATNTFVCCQAQLPELLTQLDKNFTALSAHVETLEPIKYREIKDILFNAAVDFGIIVYQKLKIHMDFDNNPLHQLTDLFWEPQKLAVVNFDTFKAPVKDKIDKIIEWISRLTSRYYIPPYAQDKSIENALKASQELQDRLTQLNNPQLWPDQQIFKSIQPLFTFIKEQLERIPAAVEAQRAKIETMEEEEEEFGEI